MQLRHKLRYLAGWTYTITCGFLLFCDTLVVVLQQKYQVSTGRNTSCIVSSVQPVIPPEEFDKNGKHT